MRKLLPFGLLIPSALLAGIFVAELLGYPPPYGSPVSTLLGAAAWTLLFLIIYGNQRGWRSVRVFLVIFVTGKFGAILYRQLAYDIPVARLLMELAGAAVIAWLFFFIFWPRRPSDEKPSA